MDARYFRCGPFFSSLSRESFNIFSIAIVLFQSFRLEVLNKIAIRCLGRLFHSICEQLSHLQVGEERDAEIDSKSSDVIVCFNAFRKVVCEHEHQVDLSGR